MECCVAGNDPAQLLDPSREHLRVSHLLLHVRCEGLLHLLRSHAIEVHRVGDVVDRRLYLRPVRDDQLLDYLRGALFCCHGLASRMAMSDCGSVQL